MIVSIPVANLIQGVSQQPPQMRLASQASEQINAYSSPTDGLTKRPPTKFQCPLEASGGDNETRFHFIERDVTERYILKIKNNDTPTIHGLDGVSYAVGWGGVYGAAVLTSWTNYMAGSGYTGSDCLSVADYTFIVNKTKTVAMTAATISTHVDEALVTVVQANYKTNYIITMKDTGGVTKTFTVATYNGTNAASGEVSTIKTDDTAATLTAAINAATAASGWSSGYGFTAVRYGSTIHIYGNNSSSKFTIKATDSGGDSFLIACKDTIARLSDLPVQAPADFVIAVNPDPEVKGNTYYVKFTTASADANGVWTECVAPGVTYVLDKATTPFVMKRKSDSNGIWFSIEEGPWANRTVGDTVTAKSPSFVGRTLQDIFFFKNRLGFLAGDKVCMSESGAYFNFFKTSVAQTIDSDPIDVGTLSTSVSTLNKAVAQGDRLLLFGDKAQFVLGTSDNSPLTPTSVTSTMTTEYANASSTCPPVASGKTILFAQADSKYCGIREFYKTSMSSTVDQYDGIDLTANVNSYIEKTPRKLAVSSYDNLAVVLTDTGYDRSQIDSTTGAVLYSYKWMMNGSDKIQSAWSKWVFPKTRSIKAIHWINKKLYMIVDRNSKYQVEVMDFEVRVPDPATFIPHLDCYTHLTNTTYTGGVSSASTMNDDNSSTVDMSWVSNLTAVYKGKLSNITSVSGVTVTSNINWLGGGEAYVGIPYDMKYTFSPIYLRNQNVPVLDGRLSLTYGSITFADTGFFSVSITPTFRDSYAYLRDEKTYEYFGGGVSAAYYTDTVNLPTGTFRFPIHSKNDDVTVTVSNNSHMPIRLNSAVFEAHYVTRSRG